MIFSGEPISGERAEQIGLVTQVVDDGSALVEAQRLAATIANGPLFALKMAKAAILASAETPLAMGLSVERHAAARVFASPEGVEDSKPSWKRGRPGSYRPDLEGWDAPFDAVTITSDETSLPQG